jgi:integrase
MSFHHPKPFYKADRNTWYAEVGRKQIPLGVHPRHLPPPQPKVLPGKKRRLWTPPNEIQDAYHKVMAGAGLSGRPSAVPEAASLTVVEVLDYFLDWCRIHRSPETYRCYTERLQSFTDYLKAQSLSSLTVEELRPFHVREWADSHADWNPGMKRGRMAAAQRAFNLAVEEGKIDRSPIAKITKPPAGRRENVVTPAEFAKLLTAVRNEPFRDLLTVAWECGCRPQEISRVEARHLDEEKRRWVFPIREAKGKKRIRIVYLTDNAFAITKKLCQRYPTGPLFRNVDGHALTTQGVSSAFVRLKPVLGRKVALVDLRHSFVTPGIKRGVDPITLATLCGHADPTMVAKTYSHLSQDDAHLRNALGKIVRREGDAA